MHKGFNAKVFAARSLVKLKVKYDNIKSKAKKEVAQQKQYFTGTGGGPSTLKDLDPITSLILEIINLKTVVGLTSSFDSDTIAYNVFLILV